MDKAGGLLLANSKEDFWTSATRPTKDCVRDRQQADRYLFIFALTQLLVRVANLLAMFEQTNVNLPLVLGVGPSVNTLPARKQLLILLPLVQLLGLKTLGWFCILSYFLKED